MENKKIDPPPVIIWEGVVVAPRFSIVVPSYGNKQYLPSCIRSLENQSFQNWEAIIVDDASVDGSLSVARELRSRDSRIVVVEKRTNGGLHLARKSGVARCRGQFVMFLDADDEYEPGFLQELDCSLANESRTIVHFGINVIPEKGVSEKEASALSRSANCSWEELEGSRIMDPVFDSRFGFQRDWRVTQRVFPARMAIRVFSKMVDRRLQGAEDGYEYFLLSDAANREITLNSIKGYRYYLGRGSTNSDLLTAEEFAKLSRSYWNCSEAVRGYVRSKQDDRLSRLSDDFRARLVETLATTWKGRVESTEKQAAVHYFVDDFGPHDVSSQLFRAVRDDAYALWDSGGTLNGSEPFIEWLELADELKKSSGLSRKIIPYESQAKSHMEDLKGRTYQERRKAKNDSSFVTRLARRLTR